MLTPRHVQAIASTRDRNMLVLRRLFVDAHGSFKSLLSSDTDGHLSDELWAVRTLCAHRSAFARSGCAQQRPL